MKERIIPISKAIEILNENLSEVARISEWAKKMEYNDPQKFAYHFLKFYGARPLKFMEYIRLKSIVRLLQADDKYSNLEIAQAHGLTEEKALNNFTNYHLGCSPTQLKNMSESELRVCFKKFGNKIKEQI